ncbi:hypothetical protein [Phreatobacter sp.]|nr:hypothetical protein [Phreatobacter sp.]
MTFLRPALPAFLVATGLATPALAAPVTCAQDGFTKVLRRAH